MPNNISHRPFNALNGAELKALVLKEVREAIDRDFHFQEQLTYPVVTFAFKLAVTAFPCDPPGFTIESAATLEDKNAPKPVNRPESAEASGNVNVDAPNDAGLTPDQARRRAGLPVPLPSPSYGGTVDRRSGQ